MPPRKEKAEKLTLNEATATILKYLEEQQRPYATQDVFTNLHSKIPKAQCQRALSLLAEQSQIVSKTSGKATVYHAKPPTQESLSQAEVEAMDAQLAKLQEEVNVLKEQEKSLRLKLSSLESASSIETLEAELQRQKAIETELEQRLAGQDSGKAYSAEEAAEISRQWKENKTKVQDAKRLFEDLWGIITENIPDGKSVTELEEELGLELGHE